MGFRVEGLGFLSRKRVQRFTGIKEQVWGFKFGARLFYRSIWGLNPLKHGL